MRNIAASETIFATLFTGGDFFPPVFLCLQILSGVHACSDGGWG